MRSAEKRLMLDQDLVRQSVAEARRKAQVESEASELRLSAARKRIEETLTRASGLEATLTVTQKALDVARADAERANERMSALVLAILVNKEGPKAIEGECWCRPKIDPPCRSKFDPGWGAAFLISNCGQVYQIKKGNSWRAQPGTNSPSVLFCI